MSKIKAGFAFHTHHNTLVAWCYDYDGRAKYIQERKPPEQRELRLRLFKMIPEALLPKELIEAKKTFDEARKTYDKAGKAYAEAGKAFAEVEKTYAEAEKTFNEAWETYDKAEKACMPELIKLHEELCPNCPFDGHTIFPQKGGK